LTVKLVIHLHCSVVSGTAIPRAELTIWMARSGLTPELARIPIATSAERPMP